MSDIVEWLLQQGEWTGDKTWATEPHCAEAAEEITRLRAENEKLRLEMDMQQATILVPSQKDDQRRIERLDAALKEALDEAAQLRRCVKTAIMGDSAELADMKRENEKLRAVLRPFAANAIKYDRLVYDGDEARGIAIGFVRAAAAAYKEAEV